MKMDDEYENRVLAEETILLEFQALEEKLSVAVEVLETLEVAVNDKVNDPGATNFIREALTKIKGGSDDKN